MFLFIGEHLVPFVTLTKGSSNAFKEVKHVESVLWPSRLPDHIQYVLIHDAAGWHISDLSLILRMPEGSQLCPLLPVIDTIKQDSGKIETLDRSKLWAAQAPQGFGVDILRQAGNAAPEETDEIQAINLWDTRRYPWVLTKHESNETRGFVMVRALLQEEMISITGQGFDVTNSARQRKQKIAP